MEIIKKNGKDYYEYSENEQNLIELSIHGIDGLIELSKSYCRENTNKGLFFPIMTGLNKMKEEVSRVKEIF